MKAKLKRSVVEATAGAVKSRRKRRPLTAEELRQVAEVAIAEDVIKRSGDTRRGKRPRVRYGK